MNKKEKLKYCNYALLALLPIVSISSILLEISGGEEICSIPYNTNVLIHIIITVITFALVVYHLYLHFGNKAWKQKINKLKSKVTKRLVFITLLTTISGLIAVALYLESPTHSHIGAIHGKIGFIFLIVAIGHTMKRWKWFR